MSRFLPFQVPTSDPLGISKPLGNLAQRHAGSIELGYLTQKSGQIIDAVKPIEGEIIIKKTFPNAFAGTDLLSVLRIYPSRDQLIVAGFMTHMCIASTASSAIDNGYFTTVVSSTTTTRDLKGPGGEAIPARAVKNAALATLKDRFSLVLNDIQELQD